MIKKTHLDLQERFPDIPCVSQMSGSLSFQLSIPTQNGLAFRQDHEKVGITLIDWERGKSPLRTDSASFFSLESFRQLTSF